MIYPEAEEGKVAMELLRTRRRPNGKQTEQLAVHFTYNQTFIPVQGSMVLIVAPPPTDREADPETHDFDFDQAAAFLVEPGQVALIEKGVTAERHDGRMDQIPPCVHMWAISISRNATTAGSNWSCRARDFA